MLLAKVSENVSDQAAEGGHQVLVLGVLLTELVQQLHQAVCNMQWLPTDRLSYILEGVPAALMNTCSFTTLQMKPILSAEIVPFFNLHFLPLLLDIMPTFLRSFVIKMILIVPFC